MNGLTLERLLWSLAEAGEFDSAGGFTVSAELAERKLRDYRLPLPQSYALKAVQFAVASGAKRISVVDTLSRLEVRFDGESIAAEDLERLLVYLLDPCLHSEKQHFLHLAGALCGATAVAPQQIVFRHMSRGRSFRTSWSEQGWKRERGESRSEDTESVLLIARTFRQRLRQAASRLSRFVGLSSDSESESQLIARLCHYVPAALSINGNALPRRPFGAERSTQGLPEAELIAGLYHPHSHLVERSYPAVVGSPAGLPSPTESSHSERFFAYLGVRAELADHAQILYVDDGVTLGQRRYLDLPCPGLFGVVSSEHLNKDLSGFQLREDRVFAQHKEWLKEEAHLLRQSLRSFAQNESEPMRRRIRDAIRRVETIPW